VHPDGVIPTEQVRSVAGSVEDRLLGAARDPELAVYRACGGSPKGLTEREAQRRLAGTGSQRTPQARIRPVATPFSLLLLGLGAVLAAIGDIRGAVTMAFMVAVSAALRRRARSWSQRVLKQRTPGGRTTVTVRRRATAEGPAREREISPDELVVGDVVRLRAGDVVAADLRVVRCEGLSVDQAALSGEALALVKAATLEAAASGGPATVSRLPTLCFAGTTVVGGGGTGVVVATGAATLLGALHDRARRPRPASRVDADVSRVARTLLRFLAVLAPIVLVTSGLITGSWPQAALYAAAVATGLVPELLPVVVTTGLVRAARQLGRRGLVIACLDAIHDLAAIDVICLDKTGTLTQGRALLAHSLDSEGRRGDDALDRARLAAVLRGNPSTPTDAALLTLAPAADPAWELERVDDDPALRWTSTVVRGADGTCVRITCGDPQPVLAVCGASQRAAASAAAEAERGLRVMAVATRAEPPGTASPDELEDLGDVAAGSTLVGFVSFLDPVRACARQVVARLGDRGVSPYLLTGDGAAAAAAVSAQIDLDAPVVSAAQVRRAQADGTLSDLLRRGRVFADLDAGLKAAVVGALRGSGHTVAFLGDGANDAPALRLADVGIAVDTATAAARDASDVVLVGPDLTAVADAVTIGRAALGNARKYVQLTTAANLGNVVSIVLAGLFLPFLPMLPIQLVAQNLVYDLVQLTMPWDRVDPEYLARPRRWPRRGLTAFMLTFGPLSSLFDLATFAVLDRVLGLDTTAEQAAFQAGWFTVGLLSQCTVVLVLRTGAPWRTPAKALALASGLGATVAVVLPHSPVAPLLGMVAPPVGALGWQLGIVAAYLATMQLLKLAVLRGDRTRLLS